MVLKLVPEPGGLENVERQPSASPTAADCQIIRTSFFRRNYGCGHSGARSFHFLIWGAKVEFNGRFLKGNRLCPACLLSQLMPRIIRCADCEGPIMPGAAVATPCRDERDAGKDWLTTVPGPNGGLVVVCLCADNALGFSGHWNGSAIRRITWEPVEEE